MRPALSGGDFIIASRLYCTINVGELFVINHPSYGRIVKRVKALSPSQCIFFTSDNDEGISSEQIGSVDKQLIQGKVLFSIKQQY